MFNDFSTLADSSNDFARVHYSKKHWVFPYPDTFCSIAIYGSHCVPFEPVTEKLNPV
mgnify:CR=1 FL=1